jgi:beta-glucosidase
LPAWLGERGGFEAPDVAMRMGDYAARVGAAMGDVIGLACTVNEPNIVALMGYLLGAFPPGASDRSRFEAVSSTLRRAHREMVAALRAGPGTFPVGLTLSMAEIEAIEGGEARRDEAIEFLEDAYLRELGGDDFLGVQTYTRLRFGPDGPVDVPEGARRTQMGYERRPQSVEYAVRRAAAVTGLPIVVTETGIATNDDDDRISYIDEVTAGLATCLSDGIDLRGMYYWSLLDNFEWALGYTQRFGLVACDRVTFERRPKPSAAHLGQIARTGLASRRAPIVAL